MIRQTSGHQFPNAIRSRSARVWLIGLLADFGRVGI